MTLSVYGNNKLHTERPNDAWTKLYDLVPAQAAVLDVGCSSGNFGAELIRHKQCTVTGIDISEADLKIAKEQLTKAFMRNIEQEDIKDLGTFDVIVMADVIEHLIDPVSALKKIMRQLKPKGKIVFSVPNMANFATRLELLYGRFEYTEFGLLDETHLHYYDRIELEKTFARAGLHIVEYNNTIRDVPIKAVEQQLTKMGLVAKEKFWKLSHHLDATTFQFIGIAEVGHESHVVLNTKTPHDFVSDMIDAGNRGYEQQIDALQQKVAELKDELTASEQAKRNAENELHKITSSKGWRMLTTIYTVKAKFKNSRRQ